jgi:hypothetical protein
MGMSSTPCRIITYLNVCVAKSTASALWRELRADRGSCAVGPVWESKVTALQFLKIFVSIFSICWPCQGLESLSEEPMVATSVLGGGVLLWVVLSQLLLTSYSCFMLFLGWFGLSHELGWELAVLCSFYLHECVYHLYSRPLEWYPDCGWYIPIMMDIIFHYDILIILIMISRFWLDCGWYIPIIYNIPVFFHGNITSP